MPYWRLSSFYFFYFASLGALLPYWTPYLKNLGFSSFQIGNLMAIVMATKIIAPNVWGWIADHTGKRMYIVRLASLLGAICFAGVFISDDFWWLVLVMSTFSFFWNASLPQLEATTMNHLGERTHHYNMIRMWGSIGFIVLAVGLGYIVDWRGQYVVPQVILLLFALIWVTSLLVPEQAAVNIPHEKTSLRSVLGRKDVVALLASCFLIQAGHGPYYTFYTIYMGEHGYASGLIGQLWALGVIAEIILFLFMFRLMPRFGCRRLLLVALMLTTIRWVLIAKLPDSLPVVIFAQLFHAASFGVVHAVAIYLIHRSFTGRHQGRGQALYSSISFGAGGAFGAFYSGMLWQSIGGGQVFMIAALCSCLALWVVYRGVFDEV